jgi:two-component system, cell cycle sensor histidine kinase PleC
MIWVWQLPGLSPANDAAMSRLRVIKAILAASIAIFTLAGVSVSIAVLEQQKALREVSRYNMVWAVSQAVAEFYRFEQRIAAFATDRADKEEVDLRFQILRNRLGILRRGEVNDFTRARPEERATVDDYERLLGAIAPMVQEVETPGIIPRMLDMLKPFEAKLARLAAAANAYGSDLTASDQQYLLLLHWVFAGITAALVISGLAFIVLLFLQNRLLTIAYKQTSALAYDLQIAKDVADAASEAKSRFLATMSHELRTPLNAVIGFSEIIATEAFGSVGTPAYQRYATDILASGKHMLELVNDVLTMAKLDAGRYDLELSPINLCETVDKAVTMFRGTANFERREIEITDDLRWSRLMADERAVRQILLNLLSNAAKFSDPDKSIEVRCDTLPDGETRISVIDRGIGMTPDQVIQAIQPFFQADSRLSRKYEGTGLGLSIVSGLIECHGGRLIIDSEPDVGSRVSVAFPPAAICPEATKVTVAA